MGIYTEEFWEILLNVIAFCLCGLVILCLRKNLKAQGRPWIKSLFGYRAPRQSAEKRVIKNKAKVSQNELKGRGNGNLGNLSEVLAQLVRQSEMAFTMISDTIKIEREVLREFIERGRMSNGIKHLLTEELSQIRECPQEKRVRHPEDSNSENDQYGEVVRLANLGLSINEIYEKVRMPKGEIELIIKLNKQGYVYDRKSQARAQALA
jgi:hypothetical protein